MFRIAVLVRSEWPQILVLDGDNPKTKSKGKVPYVTITGAKDVGADDNMTITPD